MGHGSMLEKGVALIIAEVSAYLPRLLAASAFLVLAYIGIGLASRAARRLFARRYGEPELEGFGTALTRGLLWFAASLVLLSILGFEEIAAALGTASGFVALGLAFAAKDMIADTVAGFRLIRDEDFVPGDRVKTADTEGVIASVDLRKTRIDLDSGDRTVVSNSAVEKKWTRIEE